jgi:hypothetical protein
MARKIEKKGEAKSDRDQVLEIEEDLERLRVVFEQYFLGIEKRPPLERRAEIQRALRLMQTKRIQHTVTRFQFQGLVGRFNILDAYWTRTLRRIEDGTYERDLFRAKLKQPSARKPGAAQANDAEAGASVSSAAESASASAGNAPLLSEDRLQQVYRDFIEARRFCGESTDGLDYDRIRDKLLAEAPKVAAKAQGARVDFQVVIRDGRAILKAVPVREP